MTYCVAVKVNQGLVFASDSRTNAGVDHISTYGKMHTFCGDGERFFTLVTAGNLATSRAVITRLRRDIEDGAETNLTTVTRLTGAADYIGRVSVAEQQKHEKGSKGKQFSSGASFILGGQIRGSEHSILLIYPEGNYIPVSRHSPYLQIGEEKYRKANPQSHHRARAQPRSRRQVCARLDGFHHAKQRERGAAHRSPPVLGRLATARQRSDFR